MGDEPADLLIEALMVGDPLPVADLIDRPDWMRDAACREHPEVSFFPERGQSTDEARGVCDGCLVRSECLDYAVSIGERHGVWGGTSGQQRKRLRRVPSSVAA